MAEQLSLLNWRPPAEILPFPSHRSHGATAGVAKAIMDLDTPKRTGRLNSIRAQTRKRMEPLFGADTAEKIADDLLRMIRIQIAYHEGLKTPPPKQTKSGTAIFSLTFPRSPINPHGDSAGEASAPVPRAVPLAGVGGAHEEYDAARACEGGAA